MASKKPGKRSEESDVTRGLQVRRVRLDSIEHHPDNRRTHNEQSIAAVMASLSAFGQVEPLVVQKSSRRVIGGNGRLEAMKRLEWVECDIVEIDCADDVARRLMIVLNRTAEMSEWDAAVAGEIDQLLEGLDDADLRFLLEDLARQMQSGQPLPDAAGEAGKPEGPDEMELRPHEHYDYVIVLARTTQEWHNLLDRLGIDPAQHPPRKGKRVGCGRAISAAKLLERIDA
jgi:hypothetical protein